MKTRNLISAAATLTLICLVSLASGCATQPQLYYFGDYSRTLYHLKKEPTPETYARHEKSLRNVIETSNKKNLRVPPGIYCELGYLLNTQGKAAEAENYFNLEIQTYPESVKFVTFVRNNLKK